MEINIYEKLEKINIAGQILRNVSMHFHTTFKTGGVADYFAVPSNYEDLIRLLKFVKKYNIPVFILGGGANILVADKGIRGIVIDMKNLGETQFEGNICTSGVGYPISNLAVNAAEKQLSGLEFIYGMPGSIGGAVWMNARCYDISISDILIKVVYLNEKLEKKVLEADEIKNTFTYKDTPFQHSFNVILSASFELSKGIEEKIWGEMRQHKKDRESKGHYRYPCAGSIFKNNRAFNRPTGVIIDSLGLKGYTRGDASVANFHGNIIINKGKASSKNIKDIIDYIKIFVQKKLGLKLETEIELIGDWEKKNEHMD